MPAFPIHFMKQTAHRAPHVAREKGQSIYEEAFPFKCYTAPTNLLVRTTGREEAVASMTLYCQQPVLLTDKIWIPGESPEDGSKARHPLKVECFFDPLTGAVSHYAVVI